MKRSERTTAKRFRAYKQILQKDQDWDYGFLIALEKKKLQRMLDWWSDPKNPQASGAEVIQRDLRLALSLLRVSEGNDYDPQIHRLNPMRVKDHILTFEGPEDWWKGHMPYVNIRNVKRFLPGAPKEMIQRAPWTLREQKAWYLYNKLRAYRMQTWWD